MSHYVVTWEPRPCERCGFVRKRVKVTRAGGGEPYWHRNCTACEHDRSAKSLRDAAEKHERLARIIRADRVRRPL